MRGIGRRYRRFGRRPVHLLVAVAFVSLVHYVYKLVCIETSGFGVPPRAWCVVGVSRTSEPMESVAQLAARCGDAPGLKYRRARLSAVLGDYPEGAAIDEHIFKA